MCRTISKWMAGIVFMAAFAAYGQDAAEIRNEMNELRQRLADLEARLQETQVDTGQLRAQIKDELRREMGYDFVTQEDLGMFRDQLSRVSVGGDLNIRFYDTINGKLDGDRKTNYLGAGFRSFYLYLDAQLTDRLSVSVAPTFSGGSTGATPRLNNLSANKTGLSARFSGFNRAQATYLLPHGFELTGGLLRPRFTLDYGAEMFYHEENHASFVSANPFLGAWHDAGLELYRNFDFDRFSLPVHLYLLNGDGRSSSLEYADNNHSPAGMIHIEPQIGALTLSGSFGAGKYDNDNSDNFYRWAAGLMYQYQKFTLRSEVMGSNYQNMKQNGDDAKAHGYYVKLFYNVLPNLRLMANYNVANHNFSGFFGPHAGNADETYKTLTFGLNYEIAPAATLLVQYDIARQERDTTPTRELDYDRLSVGARITF